MPSIEYGGMIQLSESFNFPSGDTNQFHAIYSPGWQPIASLGMLKMTWGSLSLAIWENYNHTLPETNIAPENRPSQKETNIPTIHFQVLC